MSDTVAASPASATACPVVLHNSPVTALVRSATAAIVTDIQWGSVSSILTAAFRIVPKIQELAKDLPGAQKFDILVSVLDDGLVAWGELDAANKERVGELRTDLRDLLAPSIAAMISAVHSGDVALSAQAIVQTAVAVVGATRGWKCCGVAVAK